jgi:hypothetical protein
MKLLNLIKGGAMTQGLPNRPRIDPSHGGGIPYSKIETLPQKATPVAKVATTVFEQVKQKKPEKSIWDFIFSPLVGAKYYSLEYCFGKFDAEEDRKVLQAIFGDTSALDKEIGQHVPFLREFAQEFLANSGLLGEAFQENPDEIEEYFNRLVHHMILSAALKTLPPDLQKKVKKGEPLPEKLVVEEAVAKFLKQALQVFGKDLNEIDRQAMKGKPLDAKLIRPLVVKFYEYLFPEDDSFHNFIDAISNLHKFPHPLSSFKEEMMDKIAKNLGGLYQPFFDLLQGEKAAEKEAASPLPGQKESQEWVGRLFIRSITSSSKKEDIAFLKSKGIQDPERLTQQMSPALSQSLLKFLPFTQNLENGAALDQAAESLLLHAVASVAKATGKDPLNSATLLEDVLGHLAGMVREGVASIDPSKKGDAASFSATSIKIMSLFIPPNNEWAVDFLKRRETLQKSSLNQFLFQMYKATEGEKEVKERLVARIGSQEGADHLEALCNQIADAASNKILDEFLSKPEKIEDILKGDSKDAARLISGIFTSKDPNLQWLGNSMAQAGGLQLLKGLTHFLEKIPKAKGESVEDLCFASFEVLLKAGTDYLPKAASQLKDNNQEEGAKILLSFTQELTSLFYSPAKLEVQGTLAGKGFEKAQEFAAKELAKAMTYSSNLLAHKEGNQKKLEALYGSDNPSKMGDLLGHAARQVIPSQLNASAPERAKNVVDKLTSFIQLDDSQKESIEEGIARSLNKIGSEKLLENTGTLEWIGQLSESAFLEFFLNFSKGIQKLEQQGEKPLIEEIAMMALNGLSSHLKNLGDAKEALRKKMDPRSQENIYREYEANNVLASELKDPAKKEDFYKKLTSQLFMLFETDLRKELPEIAANAIDQFIVPMILSAAVTEALTPDTMHRLLSDLLKKAANASETSKIPFSKLFPNSNEIKKRLADREKREQLSKEDYHKEITEVLTELIKNAVYLQPSNVVRGLGERRGLTKGAAEGIADTLCMNLREGGKEASQPLFLMNKAMGILLDEAFPSEKNPETGKYEYGKWDKGDKETRKLKPESITSSPNLKPFIPETREEKLEFDAKNKEEIKKAVKNVPKFLRRHIHLVASAYILDVFFRLWDKMEEKIQSALPNLSRLIIPVLQALIKAPLFIIIFFFNILASFLARAVVRVLFHDAAQKLANNIKYATPENFVYELFNDVMKNVDEKRKKI